MQGATRQWQRWLGTNNKHGQRNEDNERQNRGRRLEPLGRGRSRTAPPHTGTSRRSCTARRARPRRRRTCSGVEVSQRRQNSPAGRGRSPRTLRDGARQSSLYLRNRPCGRIAHHRRRRLPLCGRNVAHGWSALNAVFIQVDSTPNPLTRKFSLGVHLTDAPYEVASLPRVPDVLVPLFGVGIAAIFVGRDYLSLTVEDEAMWPELQVRAREVITETAGDFTSLSRPETADVSDDPLVAKIRGLLDSHIRPAVAHDGGDIRFHSFDDKGVLHLKMSGACAGCPSSPATLKLGIRNLMRSYVPEVRDVEAVA
ncbi:hypothetical protein GOB57_25040 [Sinorhizobium meliloti]|nr:hypothetical protein [Sinorhizobium meliloti]